MVCGGSFRFGFRQQGITGGEEGFRIGVAVSIVDVVLQS